MNRSRNENMITTEKTPEYVIITRAAFIWYKPLFFPFDMNLYVTQNVAQYPLHHITYMYAPIAPDKAVYCVFTQFLGPKNAIKFISLRTKTQ